MKAQDLVRVVRHPDFGFFPHLTGEIAFIEEIQEMVDGKRYAYIKTLKAEGGIFGGAGSYPTDCLRVINDDPEAIRRKKLHDEYNAKLQQENSKWSDWCKQTRREALEKAADETGVSMRSTIRIFEICENYLNEIDSRRG